MLNTFAICSAMGQEMQGAPEVDCESALQPTSTVKDQKEIDELASLMDLVDHLSLQGPSNPLNAPLLPWSLGEVSSRLAHPFWHEIQVMTESYVGTIDGFIRDTTEVEENYSSFVSFHEQKLKLLESPNKVWEELCSDLERPVLKGESALEQAQSIQLSFEVDKLKQQCIDSYSKLIGMRLKLDELNLSISRILDQRIQRIINQP